MWVLKGALERGSGPCLLHTTLAVLILAKSSGELRQPSRLFRLKTSCGRKKVGIILVCPIYTLIICTGVSQSVHQNVPWVDTTQMSQRKRAIFLGPEFCVPFHLVKNQVEVFRCEAHISLLGMVINGWAATSVFESSWGGASKICLDLREKKERLCPSFNILALPLFFSLCFFLFSSLPTLHLSTSLFHPLFFSALSPSCPFTFLIFFLTFSFCLPLLNLSYSLAYLILSHLSLPSLLSLFFSFSLFTFGEKTKDLAIMSNISKLATDQRDRLYIFYLLISSLGDIPSM